MFKNDPDKSIDMLASGGAAVLANDGAATGCVEATEAEAAVASKPLDEKSDNRGYGNVSAGVGDEVGVGIAEGAARPLRSVPAKSFGYRFVKRVFDIGFSLCVIVIGFVPVALLCLIIRLESPGSPIYFQKRVGRYGTSLSILKLRTMVADSDDVEKYLSPEQLAQWKSERKVDCDPRVTRVGALLRKTSLASVIIGTPGDGESTKSLSRSANSSLDLQLCERRPGLCCFARTQYKRFQFLSVVVFRDARGVFNRTFTRISSLVPSAPLRGYAEGCSSFLSISKAVRCNDGGECCRRVA